MSDIFTDTINLATKAFANPTLDADGVQTLASHAMRSAEWGEVVRDDLQRRQTKLLHAAVLLVVSLESRSEHIFDMNRDVFIRRTVEDVFGPVITRQAMRLWKAFDVSAPAIVERGLHHDAGRKWEAELLDAAKRAADHLGEIERNGRALEATAEVRVQLTGAIA